MPRQLPWKSSGGGSRTQTIKPSARQSKATKIPDDIDDDVFDGSAFASSSKDKGKAKAASDSDDSLPEPDTAAPTSRTRNTLPNERAPSSSPPPPADCALPHDEPMRKGVSVFDLRDDEWMMVEDEFLETASLFTRHLRIAEYERLKESIEAKKKEVDIARPVVAGAKRSVNGAMKERARVQESRQKRAIRDVFLSQGDSSGDDRASYRPRPSNVPSIAARPPPFTSESQETDSDDLDAPRPPKPRAPSPATMPAARARPAYLETSRPTTTSFVKPALPTTTAAARPRSRPARMTPFDMLDEYSLPTFDRSAVPAATSPERQPSSASKSRSQSTPSNHSSLQASQTTAARTMKPRRSVDLLDESDSSGLNGGISRQTTDRIAKRNAERAKEGSEKDKRRVTNLDDIPTFLF